MKQKHLNIFLRAALCLMLLLAPPFSTKEARAQFVVTDLGAAAQRVKASIVEGVNFALEIEKMAEQLMTATGHLEQAKALATQMANVYSKVSGVISKGREIVRLYNVIEETRRTLETVYSEYQYYANGGSLSAARVRRMNYLISLVSRNTEDIIDYITNTLLKDTSMSSKDKKEETDKLTKSLAGQNAAINEALDEDKRDMAAKIISSIEQNMLDRMIGRMDAEADAAVADALRSTSRDGLLSAINWDNEFRLDDNEINEDPTEPIKDQSRLFRVVYILEGLITILMAPIAYFRKNKGEGNAQDALLKVVFGFFFSVILTTIVESVFFS